MPTIKDIAKTAGVSVTTVSNVIHGKRRRVAKETIERINSIIQQSNYTPNLSARTLVSKSSRIIGVINHLIYSKPINFLQDPFHGALLGGIENTLRERGYYMMIRTVADEGELYSLFNNWNLDGVILIGLFKDEFFARLLESGKPAALLDSYIKNDKIFNIGLDDFGGARLAVQYLVDRGHRNIIFAAPPFHRHGVIEERLRGYKSVLKANGIPFRSSNVYQREITVDESVELGRELARRRDFSAVFATADMLASGIIAGLAEQGRRVPRDISVIGFDDVFFSRLTAPPLTTIHQDIMRKGAIAAGVMMDYLEGKEIASRNIILP
ncbi:MAG: LacI family transcriptional regulator, partial [Treponema sp.]|nr:LacI family transcriptional regulator [Treponema sp.]